MEHTIGMRIPLILAFLILTLVPLLVQVRFTSGYFYQSHVEERMAEAQNRSLILANKIRSSDYINVLLSGNPNPALDAELSTTADLMNGRIVLVDDSFKILKDTFDLSRGKTLLVIAHRLSTIQNADQIVVLEKGSVADCGTQEELLGRCPLYQTLWTAHVGARNWAVTSGKKEGN